MNAAIAGAARRMLVIHNPAAGRRRRSRLERALVALKEAGVTPVLAETAARGDGERQAAEAGEVAAVVAAGGDGTIAEVVNGLMARPRPRPPLGIIPLGTSNVLAAELGLPLAPERAAAVLVQGASREVALGIANGRHFTLMVGVGFDARVVARVTPRLKRRLGKLAYVVETGREWLALRPCRLSLAVDGRPHEAAAAVIAKGHYYGGRFVLAPKASLATSTLEVCLFERHGRWPALRYVLATGLGLLPRLSDYRVVTGTHIRIDGPAGEPVQAEGDIIALLPLTVSVAPERLAVLVPGGTKKPHPPLTPPLKGGG